MKTIHELIPDLVFVLTSLSEAPWHINATYGDWFRIDYESPSRNWVSLTGDFSGFSADNYWECLEDPTLFDVLKLRFTVYE